MLHYLILLLTAARQGFSDYRPREESNCTTIKSVASCQNKSFQQVPVELFMDIQSLNMSKNELKNITKNPLSYYSFLELLDLSNNKISFIEPGTFTDMVNLKEINLSDNYLDRFVYHKSPGIGLLPNVQKLDLSRNSLYTDMMGYFLQNAPHLHYLSLSGNSITMISSETFAGTPNLIEIDLRNNIIMEIEEGSFDHLTNLRTINLIMNSITCISEFNLRQLESLNLNKNSLQTFHTSDSEEEFNLTYVDLSDNKLVYFPGLPRINNIITLNLSMNLIRLGDETSHEELAWLEDESLSNSTMVDLHKLTNLDLSYNNINSIPEDFFSTMPLLKFLNLSHNCIESFSFGQTVTLTFLEELDLSGNDIQNISLAANSLPSLKWIHLQNNKLQFVESKSFQGLPRIVFINLQNNNVGLCGISRQVATQYQEREGCASFFNIPTLQYLNLRENMLDNIPDYAFYGTPLTFLDFSMNLGINIGKNALKGLEGSLEVLHVEDNALHHLNVDLPLLVQLQYLNLSRNQLTWLPTWNKNCQLETLDLSNNSFSYLKDSNIPVLENTLKTLSLSGNPLSCCENSWIIHMVRRNTVTITGLDATTCQNSDGQDEEILIGQNSLENCEKGDLKNMSIVIILTVALALLVIAASVASVTCYCRQKMNQQYKAYFYVYTYLGIKIKEYLLLCEVPASSYLSMKENERLLYYQADITMSINMALQPPNGMPFAMIGVGIWGQKALWMLLCVAAGAGRWNRWISTNDLHIHVFTNYNLLQPHHQPQKFFRKKGKSQRTQQDSSKTICSFFDVHMMVYTQVKWLITTQRVGEKVDRIYLHKVTFVAFLREGFRTSSLDMLFENVETLGGPGCYSPSADNCGGVYWLPKMPDGRCRATVITPWGMVADCQLITDTVHEHTGPTKDLSTPPILSMDTHCGLPIPTKDLSTSPIVSMDTQYQTRTSLHHRYCPWTPTDLPMPTKDHFTSPILPMPPSSKQGPIHTILSMDTVA
ncbi:transforming growth factor beta activator LRRC32 [Gastrophryne carolinensis]